MIRIMSTLIDSMISNKEILIVHPYSQVEIQNPTFGGTRLIAEQISYLKGKDNIVKVISLAEISSFTSFLYRLQANLRKKESKGASNKLASYDRHSEKRRWWLNLLQVLTSEYSTRIDLLYRRSADNLMKSMGHGSVVIYHYPYGASYFASCARKNGLTFVLYQHNIEWKFFDDRLGDGLIKRTALPRAKSIELRSMSAADLVAFASDKDRLSISNENDIGKLEMISWIPIAARFTKPVAAEIPADIRAKIDGKVVAGFVGTNFEPNILAVEHLIRLARTSESLVFLIIGSVNRAFRGRDDIPNNVVFTGYVQELDSYLSHCDIFVNPKTTSDTGIEIKMFDYLKFDKYILSTETGASGFDSNKKVIISTIDEMPAKIQSLNIIGRNRT